MPSIVIGQDFVSTLTLPPEPPEPGVFSISGAVIDDVVEGVPVHLFGVGVFGPPAPPTVHTISGTVTGRAGTTLTLIDHIGNERTTVVDSSGNYSFTDVPRGLYTLIATYPHFRLDPIAPQILVMDSDLTGIDFFAASSGNYDVSGTAYDMSAGGFGFGGVVITLTTAGKLTDVAVTRSAGGFVFTATANRNYRVTPFMPGYTFNPLYLDVTGNAGSGLRFNGTRL